MCVSEGINAVCAYVSLATQVYLLENYEIVLFSEFEHWVALLNVRLRGAHQVLQLGEPNFQSYLFLLTRLLYVNCSQIPNPKSNVFEIVILAYVLLHCLDDGLMRSIFVSSASCELWSTVLSKEANVGLFDWIGWEVTLWLIGLVDFDFLRCCDD